MKKVTLLLSFILFSFSAHGQNLVGYKRKEIVKYMKENHAEMNLNKVTNNRYSYLKYTDSSDNQTFLFFLNGDSVCKEVRIICDPALKGQKISELESKYSRLDNNSWIDKRGGKKYRINAKDGRWSFVITIEAENS
jgi:hypothetical protein